MNKENVYYLFNQFFNMLRILRYRTVFSIPKLISFFLYYKAEGCNVEYLFNKSVEGKHTMHSGRRKTPLNDGYRWFILSERHINHILPLPSAIYLQLLYFLCNWNIYIILYGWWNKSWTYIYMYIAFTCEILTYYILHFCLCAFNCHESMSLDQVPTHWHTTELC